VAIWLARGFLLACLITGGRGQVVRDVGGGNARERCDFHTTFLQVCLAAILTKLGNVNEPSFSASLAAVDLHRNALRQYRYRRGNLLARRPCANGIMISRSLGIKVQKRFPEVCQRAAHSLADGDQRGQGRIGLASKKFLIGIGFVRELDRTTLFLAFNPTIRTIGAVPCT